MKVLDIYSKKDLDMITCRGESVSSIMDNWFSKFPDYYRTNYDKNIEDLTIWHVDQTYDGEAGYYSPKTKILIFKNFSSIPHELQHVASYDREKEQMAFVKNMSYPLFEMALVEGMAEYLAAKSVNRDVTDSYFECFAVSMLSSINGIFKSFYVPNHDEFISLFPNKKDIYSLMYSLDYYRHITDNLENSNENEILKTREAIKNTVDSLIDIELSFNKGLVERKRYADKFMELLNNVNLKDILEDIDEDYIDYAFYEIKKRVLRRRK